MREKKVVAFSKNIESIGFVTSTAECPQAIEITCQMGGGIISVLMAKNGTMPHIQAELRAYSVKPRKLEKNPI